MANLGTLVWLAQSGGKLAWHEKWRMMTQAMMLRWRKQASIAASPLPDERLLTPPDTAMTRAALQVLQTSSPDFLIHHALRSYCWARLFQAQTGDSRAVDDEALFVACLLHDLGLAPDYRRSDICFTVAGVEMVYELAIEQQWSERQADLAAEAIALHLNVRLEHRQSREAQLLRMGSAADVLGLGQPRISAAKRQQVVQAFPRRQFKQRMHDVLQSHTQHCPDCRLALLSQRQGFTQMLLKNPWFDE